ncbi:hypothetical protein Q5V23_004412 [Vibrio fluvialis]|nr:hypothetical protein [Vibrio fluvialis]ELL4670518.1 hypothetical protein [Vibrio fluvialis]
MGLFNALFGNSKFDPTKLHKSEHDLINCHLNQLKLVLGVNSTSKVLEELNKLRMLQNINAEIDKVLDRQDKIKIERGYLVKNESESSLKQKTIKWLRG